MTVEPPTLGRDVAIGAVSGLAAAWVMNIFQEGWSAVNRPEDGDRSSDKGEPSTVRAANAVACATTDAPVPGPLRPPAGQLVHYSFGALLGAIYGAAGNRYSWVRAGFGTAFATAVEIGADEGLVPALALSAPPDQLPLRTHAYGFVSHLVFGAALEGSRRALTSLVAKMDAIPPNSGMRR